MIGRYRYDRLRNTIVFFEFDEDHLLARDGSSGKAYVISKPLARFARKLDGKKDPYSIDPYMTEDEVTLCLRQLRRKNMLRRYRFVEGESELLYTCWAPGQNAKSKTASQVVNSLLLLTFAPSLILGMTACAKATFLFTKSSFWAGVLLSFLIGVTAHEAAHAAACCAYGGQVYEFGFTLQNNLLPGLYTLMNTEGITRQAHLLQIDAAGIEANYLLAGVLLFISGKTNSGTLLMAGVENLMLALLNSLWVKGLDGQRIVCRLLSISDSDCNTKNRTSIKERFAKGEWRSVFVDMTTDGVFALVQFSAPVLIALEFLGVLKWILF